MITMQEAQPGTYLWYGHCQLDSLTDSQPRAKVKVSPGVESTAAPQNYSHYATHNHA
jgi:hypothetical protein